MIDEFLQMIQYPFMQRAFISGLLISFAAGYLSVFVVQRRMSFIGSGLAHSALGGVALGIVLGINPTYILIPFIILMAYLILYFKERSGISFDTSIGIILAFSVSFGIILISIFDDTYQDAFSYLFGSILTLKQSDVYISFIVALLVGLTIIKHWNIWAYVTFDRELAAADGIDVKKQEHLITFAVALVVAVAIKITGIILISSMIILPAAASAILAKRFSTMTYLSVIFGMISATLGLIISYFYDYPSGAVIVILQVMIFLFAMAGKIFSK